MNNNILRFCFLFDYRFATRKIDITNKSLVIHIFLLASYSTGKYYSPAKNWFFSIFRLIKISVYPYQLGTFTAGNIVNSSLQCLPPVPTFFVFECKNFIWHIFIKKV